MMTLVATMHGLSRPHPEEHRNATSVAMRLEGRGRPVAALSFRLASLAPQDEGGTKV
jgi:hypothetical protein